MLTLILTSVAVVVALAAADMVMRRRSADRAQYWATGRN